MAIQSRAVALSANMMVNVFDGTRQPVRLGSQVLYRIIDGSQKQIVTKFAFVPSLPIELPVHDNFEDNYTVIASADGYYQAGYSPVHVSPRILAQVDLILLPKNSVLDFTNASWAALQQARPAVFRLLASGVPANFGQSRYEDLLKQKPLSLASFFNLTTAMEQLHLPVGCPLDYFKQLKWDDTFAQDRFFCYADKELLDQVRRATQQGVFVPEIGSGFFHPGATSSSISRFSLARLMYSSHSTKLTLPWSAAQSASAWSRTLIITRMSGLMPYLKCSRIK